MVSVSWNEIDVDNWLKEINAMKDMEFLRQKQSEASVAKERLIQIMYALEEEGFIRQAKSLETIIWKLETWQNK